MIFGILKESGDENRVAMLPEEAATLIKGGHKVIVEEGAGEKAFSKDQDYKNSGAEVLKREAVLSQAEVVLKINPPTEAEAGTFKAGTSLISILQPVYNSKLIKKLTDAKVNLWALDCIPRITRGQTMDVLSSQSTVAGYKAVLTAANIYPHFFPMLTTAAGTIAPAKILILGAGVAGLQAIATARKLGGVVEVFDTRPEVKEQVQSLGGKFIEVDGYADASKAGGYAVEQSEEYKAKQKEMIHKSIAKADVVITTALIPGRKAPVLVTKAMVDAMKPGSVIIDMASAMGGNCEYSENNKTVSVNGVTIVGNSNLQGTVPTDASRMFGKNILNLLKNMMKDGKITNDFGDEINSGTCVAFEGQIRHAATLEAVKNN